MLNRKTIFKRLREELQAIEEVYHIMQQSGIRFYDAGSREYRSIIWESVPFLSREWHQTAVSFLLGGAYLRGQRDALKDILELTPSQLRTITSQISRGINHGEHTTNQGFSVSSSLEGNSSEPSDGDATGLALFGGSGVSNRDNQMVPLEAEGQAPVFRGWIPDGLSDTRNPNSVWSNPTASNQGLAADIGPASPWVFRGYQDLIVYEAQIVQEEERLQQALDENLDDETPERD